MSQLVRGDLTHHPRRHAHYNRARRNTSALRHDCPGSDQALLADVAARQQHRSHPNEGVAADADAVQHGPVPDNNALLQVHRSIGVGVDDTAVLDVDARAERDGGEVATDDRAVPEIDPGREDDIARDHHPRRDIVVVDQVHGVPLLSSGPPTTTGGYSITGRTGVVHSLREWSTSTRGASGPPSAQ